MRISSRFFLFFSLSLSHLALSFAVATARISTSLCIHYDKVAFFLKMLNILPMPFSAQAPPTAVIASVARHERLVRIEVLRSSPMDTVAVRHGGRTEKKPRVPKESNKRRETRSHR